MAAVERDGVALAYQQMGSGPDVVLVHGLASNRAFWYANHAQWLVQAGYRVTLYDLRGHGYSGMPETGYSATALAADLAHLIDTLELGPVLLIGHSYGGGVALEYAAQHPHKVAGLALLDTRVNRLQPQQWLHEGPALSPLEQAVMQATPAEWDGETQVGLRYLEALARATVAGIPLPSMGHWTPFGQGRGGLRSAKQFVRMLDMTEAQREFVVMGATPARLRTQLRQMPLLLAYGGQSRCLPSQAALAQLLPQAHCTQVAHAGHFFPATHPQATRERLQAWLRSLPGQLQQVAS